MRHGFFSLYKIVTRVLCPLCVVITPLLIYDITSAPSTLDHATITNKSVTHSRSGEDYYIEAKGKYSYHESVPHAFYKQSRIGDNLELSLSPIFTEWTKAVLIHEGRIVAVGQGNDLYWMGGFAIFFLISLAAFLPDELLFSSRLLLITIPIINFAAILLWFRFFQLWTGAIDKL